MAFELTAADRAAIANNDSQYINNKGAKYYAEEHYEPAVEYYRIAAAMGDMTSVCNLGYCYMYGRSIPKNMPLALQYFKIAADRNEIDALYKLGSIYSHGADGIEADPELGVYYYKRALDYVEYSGEDSLDYPGLYYHVGKESMAGGILPTDLATAFSDLVIAYKGITREMENGIGYHKKYYEDLKELLKQPCFHRYQVDIDFLD